MLIAWEKLLAGRLNIGILASLIIVKGPLLGKYTDAC